MGSETANRIRRLGTAVLVVIVVVLLVAAAFLGFVSKPPATSPLPSATVSPTPMATNYPATNVHPAALGYLHLNSGVTSKIFLISANASYGVYPLNLVQEFTNVTVIHKGDPCFVLNLTLRNDYSINDTLPSTSNLDVNNTGHAWMTLSVALYDKTGNQVNATNITNAAVPFFNRDQFSMSNNETDTVKIVYATSNQNIDHYNVTIDYLGVWPVP